MKIVDTCVLCYRLCYQTRWGLMDDFRVAKSADFIYEFGNVFLRL